MPENNNGQDAPQNDPQHGQDAPTGQDQPTNDAPQWARDKMAEYRQEAKGYREQLQAVQDQLKRLQDEQVQREQAELEAQGEWQKLAEQRAQELQDAQNTLQQTRLESAVISAASRLGFIDPAEAVKLVDTSTIKFEDGKVLGVDEAVTILSESKPHLLKTEPSKTPPKMPDHNPSGAGKRDMSWHPLKQGSMADRSPFGQSSPNED